MNPKIPTMDLINANSPIEVRTSRELANAINASLPGNNIIIRNNIGIVDNLIINRNGTALQPIFIGDIPDSRPTLTVGNLYEQAFKIAGASFIVLHDMSILDSQGGYGINCDELDGNGSNPRSTHSILLKNLCIENTGGNNRVASLKISRIDNYGF